jgi:hypothetical protein
MTEPTIIDLHVDHGVLDAEEKKFWKKVRAREKAGLSKGNALAWVERRWYGLPEGAGGPRHRGGRKRLELKQEILDFMRERLAQGKSPGVGELEIRRENSPRMPSSKTLQRRYVPLAFPEKKRRHRWTFLILTIGTGTARRCYRLTMGLEKKSRLAKWVSSGSRR